MIHSEYTIALLDVLQGRDAMLAALDDLASDHAALAQRRLRQALSTTPPALRAELDAARAVVRAARNYTACVGAAQPQLDGVTDTAYRVLVATLRVSERVRAQLGAGYDDH